MNSFLGRKNILIVNQHGENRGDEAAMRAMLNSFEREFEDVKFTIIAQFKDKRLKIQVNQNLTILHMIMPIPQAIGLGLYAIAKFLKLSTPFLLSAQTKKIIQAYEVCDMVVSAPGGPYFGDIYYKHEVAHWFYIWLAYLYEKPLFLYAPSAGPFNLKLMNIIRKYLYKKFDILCVREEISQNALQNLLGNNVPIYLTADSALQENPQPFERTHYFKDERASFANKYLVSVSAIQYNYPGESHVARQQICYTNTILKCLMHIASKKDCHFLFFPQLYGRVHSDVPFLEALGQRLPASLSWEIVNTGFDSDMQRRLFGMTDLCIASRYHPQIFAASNGIPGICIYYEHKALGFMSLLSLKDFAFDIRNLDAVIMCKKLDEIMDRRDEISALIKSNIVEIRNNAKKTTQLIVDYYRGIYASFC
ncbi:MAG: polysaccharide pyruvyl transferase family protein [bacterium]